MRHSKSDIVTMYAALLVVAAVRKEISRPAKDCVDQAERILDLIDEHRRKDEPEESPAAREMIRDASAQARQDAGNLRRLANQTPGFGLDPLWVSNLNDIADRLEDK